MDLLAGLTRNLPLTLAVLGMVVLVIVVALVALVRKRRAPAEGVEEPGDQPENGAAAPPPRGGVVVDFRQLSSQQRLSSAFRRALSELRRHLGGRDSRYRLPWYALLGEEGSGKSGIFQGSGLNLPLGEPEELVPEEGEGCTFWFFDRGVVLDVSGEMVLRRDGQTSDERGWRQVLSLLREHRPERPLDGVILTIPCTAVVGAVQEEGQRLSGAAARGSAYFRKLRQAQEALGMLFPVYVLVTGCERLRGFTSFAGQFPEHLRGDLFGWSSPYAPEVAFRPEWVDEAFTLLGAGLHRAQVDAYGERDTLPDPDGVFCFPAEFQQMRDELRVLLSQVFRASTYHEVLPCRGIYFCGRVPTAERYGLERLRNPHAVGDSVFVRDVFDRKVFPERDLAHPTSLALLQGGRRLRVLQAAVVTLALVSTLGLWWGGRSLAKRHENLRVFLLNTAQDLQDLRALRARGETGETRGAFLRDRAFHLFEGMANLDADRFGSVFIPSSWFSDFNSDLRAAMARAYDDIILKTMNQELGRTLDEILAQAKPLRVVTEESVVSPLAEGETGRGAPAGAFIAWDAPVAGASDVHIPAVVDLPEFEQTKRYTAGLLTLENNANRFNRLRTTKNLKDLNTVVAYLFNRELPEGFFKNSTLYSEALAEVDYARFEPLPQRPRTTGRALELSDAFFGRLFDQNPAARELKAAAALAAQASGPSWEGGGAPAAVLVELHNRLKRAEEMLALPQLAWMSGETLDLGKPYKDVLGAARTSVFLGPETAQRIQEDGNRRFQDFRQDLLNIETRAGKLAYREPRTGAISLSPQAKLLADALGGLSYQGLVADTDPVPTAGGSLSSRGRVAWDVLGLQRAAALYLPYEDFIQKTLAPFPAEVRGTLQTSARDQLGVRMMAQVVHAQRPAPEPDASSSLLLEQSLEAQVTNFQAASAPIAELMSTFEKLGLFSNREQVAQAFAAQGEQILADADRLLVLTSPYRPRDNGFEWWDGGKRPGLEAFSAADEAQLAGYLAAQRGDVAEIAERFAQPVMKAFGGRASSRGLRLSMARWTAISEQLGRHKANEPGNSVAGLEELILKDMLEIEPANCSRRITTRMLTEPADDFFEERRAALRRQLYDRCRELAGGRAVEGYRRIEAFFNQRLAGRFPFADSAPGKLDPEADPEDVRELYRLYAAYAPVLRGVPETDRPAAAFDFIDKIDSVRPLFAAFLDDPLRPEAPELELAVRFRDQRKAEAGADRIFRWSLASGERVVTHPYSGPAIPWTYGAPVRLELQWAKDSPVIPVESPELPGVLVKGRTAVFEFNNRWSLLALLKTLASPQDDGDPRAETLRLRVATRPEAEPQAAPETARVFVRLALRAPRREVPPGEKAEAAAAPAEDLELPVFPVSAPRWSQGGEGP
ncbi:MAG TPA: type VI secretion protein IcmF/TssM N-terminal domain-containing protein [Thermoanaerobaculia bacterium]